MAAVDEDAGFIEDADFIEDPDELDADALGRSSGERFDRCGPMIARRPKPQRLPTQQAEPRPQRPKLRRNPGSSKIQVKPRNRGGYSDRIITGVEVKAEVITELELLWTTAPLVCDQDRDRMGRVLHYPPQVVIQPEHGNNLRCYLPALRFATGYVSPIAVQVEQLMENVNSTEINNALQSVSNLTLSRVRELSNNYQGLLTQTSGSYMLVGGCGETYNHWAAYNAWGGVLYSGTFVRVIDAADRASPESAKAVFTDGLLLDDLREVYVLKRVLKSKRKRKGNATV